MSTDRLCVRFNNSYQRAFVVMSTKLEVGLK